MLLITFGVGLSRIRKGYLDRPRTGVHLRAVTELFMAKLDDYELAVLESALKKVILDRAFG